MNKKKRRDSTSSGKLVFEATSVDDSSATAHTRKGTGEAAPEKRPSSTAEHLSTSSLDLSNRKRPKHGLAEGTVNHGELDATKPDDSKDDQETDGQSVTINDQRAVLSGILRKGPRRQPGTASSKKGTALIIRPKRIRRMTDPHRVAEVEEDVARRSDTSSQERQQAYEAMGPDRERTPEEDR
ncbi:hypothetical protein LTR86_005404 [Recurvomyces mirabilis]|nr:hypothetical protein LTR86_005404 [Recurvomyces mirabilis]